MLTLCCAIKKALGNYIYYITAIDIIYIKFIIVIRNKSPPCARFQTKFCIKEEIMKGNIKCFIKLEKGLYEEITLKELEQRRKNDSTYTNKKFIYVHKMLMEVTENEYKDYYEEIERNRYAKKVMKMLNAVSLEELQEDEDGKEKDIIADIEQDVEDDVTRKFELEQIKKALLELSDDEYKLLKAIFYQQLSVRKYAQIKDIPYSTIQFRKQKILEKLKKFLKI